MRALIADYDGKLSMGDLSMPTPTPYQALTRTVSCGVCSGTDMKIIHGQFKGVDAYPVSLGHEAIGEVVEVGSKVASFHVGDFVTLPFLYETTDGVAPAWGAFAEYGLIGDAAAMLADGVGGIDDSYFAQKVVHPEDVDLVDVAMIITFREVCSSLKHFGAKAGQTAVIYGAGPVGRCFTRFASLMGLDRIMVIDINDAKCAEAAESGATHTLNSLTANPVEWVRALAPEGVDYVIDAAGNSALLNQGMNMVKDRGKICAYGISPVMNAAFDWSLAPYNWTMQFQQMPRKPEEGAVHDQVMAWIRSGQLKLADFVSDRIPFDHITDAFDLVSEHRDSTKKIVISYPR